MSNLAIQVENISKKYELGAIGSGTLRETLAHNWDRLRGRNGQANGAEKEFWALKDINFEVKQGEVVGIIGKNGAGKSTLLKVLSRITEPTTGQIKLYGRVSSLLEVGTGFHPELTGRENIFLNGGILGMGRSEIRQKFDEIVDFSGVEKFLDTPIKRYSSGMKVRLAFAVSAHLEPEILVIDEVLAVGDAEFQKKCLGKMQDVAGQGRTVLFVSHNMAAVQNLCSRGILLRSGRVAAMGDISDIVSRYLHEETEGSGSNLEMISERKGNQRVIFAGVWMEDNNGNVIPNVQTGQDINLVFRLKNTDRTHKKIDLGFSLHNPMGDVLSVLYSSFQHQVFPSTEEEYQEIRCRIPNFSFAFPTVQVRGRILADGDEADWPKQTLLQIDVEQGDYYQTGHKGFEGRQAVLIKGEWQ